jgi:hypothetical protein
MYSFSFQRMESCVECTVYIIQGIVYSVLRTVYGVLCIGYLYSIYGIVYSVLCNVYCDGRTLVSTGV